MQLMIQLAIINRNDDCGGRKLFDENICVKRNDSVTVYLMEFTRDCE